MRDSPDVGSSRRKRMDGPLESEDEEDRLENRYRRETAYSDTRYESDERSHRQRRHRSGDDRRQKEERGDRTHERRYRDRSGSRDRSRHGRRSRSPSRRRRKESPSISRSPPRRSRGPLPSQAESFRGEKPLTGPDGQPIEKQKPNYKPTGLLAKEANTVAGTTTVLKYHEPPEARKPPSKEKWRMYVFKKKDLLDTIYLHQRSAWLVGRDQKVTDLLLEHPSISKQHAVLQFRHITSTNEYGEKSSKVKPYLIDLDSANGTKLNDQKIGASRFIELVDGDVVAFGDSEREYVMMLPPPDA